MIDKQIFLDLERLKRLKMVEAVWGENKSCEQISHILKKFKEANPEMLLEEIIEKVHFEDLSAKNKFKELVI